MNTPSFTLPVTDAAAEVRTDAVANAAALLALYAAGETLLEFWSNGSPVHCGSDAAADFKAAMIRAGESARAIGMSPEVR